jgi:hypothetical protein
METLNIKISKSAKKFIRQKGIEDVTFDLFEAGVAGCCVGVVKEITPEYKAPVDASGYRYCRVEDFHIFIARKIKILGPMKLTTEGLFKKRLFLLGTNPPI